MPGFELPFKQSPFHYRTLVPGDPGRSFTCFELENKVTFEGGTLQGVQTQ